LEGKKYEITAGTGMGPVASDISKIESEAAKPYKNKNSKSIDYSRKRPKVQMRIS